MRYLIMFTLEVVLVVSLSSRLVNRGMRRLNTFSKVTQLMTVEVGITTRAVLIPIPMFLSSIPWYSEVVLGKDLACYKKESSQIN